MKPTVVLVPGAWLVPEFYKPFLEAVQAAGFPTCTAELPSLNPVDPSAADCTMDAESIRRLVCSLVEDECRDVVLVMHSYASMPGGARCHRALEVRESQTGAERRGVGIGGNLPSWILLDQPSVGLNVPDQPEKTFAADVSEEQALAISSVIKPHASLAFFSAQPSPAWVDPTFTGRLAYVVTTDDLAVPKVAQYGMISGTGQQWHVREIESSHCAPFITKVAESVEILQDFIRAFETV
ncbi:hypothetical protein ANOM_000206 [Aspergillus nomiae NRRL 13137]|uniref:AB hydrolase-1 domain-containing protein n=1 Tax=Aspergillus nomiae NRRL (strain ATCC 15546 / NRRL 13137 / CBS 260.88 / M93) TaxID=1509407 RepID=A0A0L1JIW9_ASPN3|nr:uncharacterized protein ANOM_000206 [Aspergillus nomiae NRRL 13137]KNG91652.1 hypothetical protein ANOM_000206 [Aspergillus nomiae NRRL 13137]